MSENDDLEKNASDAESISPLPDAKAKPKKKKREWVMTEAREKAFARCRQKREENLAKLKKGRELKRIEEKEKKLKDRKEAIDTAEKASEKETEAESDASEESISPVKAPTKKKKKKRVVIQDDSDISDSSVDVVVKRKPRKKQSPKPKEAKPPKEKPPKKEKTPPSAKVRQSHSRSSIERSGQKQQTDEVDYEQPRQVSYADASPEFIFI